MDIMLDKSHECETCNQGKSGSSREVVIREIDLESIDHQKQVAALLFGDIDGHEEAWESNMQENASLWGGYHIAAFQDGRIIAYADCGEDGYLLQSAGPEPLADYLEALVSKAKLPVRTSNCNENDLIEQAVGKLLPESQRNSGKANEIRRALKLTMSPVVLAATAERRKNGGSPPQEGATAAKRPRQIISIRRTHCSDCRNAINAHNPGAEVNGRRVCPHCAELYHWSALMGAWVINSGSPIDC